MTTIVERLGITQNRLSALEQELEENARNDQNGNSIDAFLEVAQGKPANEILMLGIWLERFIVFCIERRE